LTGFALANRRQRFAASLDGSATFPSGKIFKKRLDISYQDLVKPAGKELNNKEGKIMKKKFITQLALKFTKKNALLLAIAALALSTSAASAATHYWTRPSSSGAGSWFDSSNWDNGIDGIPDCTTNADIDNGGTAQVSSANATASADDLTIGYGTADSGKVSVIGATGGSLSICGSVFVARQGTGSMTVTAGGSVGGAVATSGNLSIASQSGQLWTSNGSASVDGSSTWTVSDEVDVGGTTSGAGGTGLLSVTNGGTVSAGTSVHVWNSGTLSGKGTVNVNSGSGTATIDGTLSPNWTLTINGNLTFTSTNSLMQCNVTANNSGNDADVTGAATLNGKLSVTLNGTFTTPAVFHLLHADGGLGTTSFSSYSFTYTGCLSPSIVYDRVHGNVDLHVDSSCQ
jgi:hypothetical protein